MDVRRARVRHARNTDLGEEVDAIGGHGDTDGCEVVFAKGGEVLVRKVLHDGEVLGLMLWNRMRAGKVLKGKEEAYSGSHDECGQVCS